MNSFDLIVIGNEVSQTDHIRGIRGRRRGAGRSVISHMGNGTGLMVKRVGNSFLSSPFEKNSSLKLSNLLHVPHMHEYKSG